MQTLLLSDTRPASWSGMRDATAVPSAPPTAIAAKVVTMRFLVFMREPPLFADDDRP